MKILIIDDYQSHGESLVELVGTLGHEARYVPTYAEARGFLVRVSFDLAFVDFDMPAMPGPAVAAELQEEFPRIRPVIMSGVEPDEERRRQIGPWRFLQKPLCRDVLEQVLAELAREITAYSLMPRATWSILPAMRNSGPLMLPPELGRAGRRTGSGSASAPGRAGADPAPLPDPGEHQESVEDDDARER